jgi:N-acyl-D-aspartate/D-glutamate deacylase
MDVMESVAHPELCGRRLDDLAAERGVDPFDVLLDLALDEPDLALRVRAVVANDEIEGVTTLLREDGCVLGLSDAGAHVGQLCDAPLPTDLLGNWVRARGTISLEQAVYKLTGEPAGLFGFADRGVLRPGAWADITIFEPDTVGPGPLRRLRDFPADGERLTADQPTGVRAVYVGGRAVVEANAITEAARADPPGQVVRPGPSTLA